MKQKHFNPVTGILQMRDEFLIPFDRVFDQMMNNQFPNFSEQTGIDFEKGAYPKCNIIDYDASIDIVAEIPGLTKEDVSIKVEDGLLTLSGKSKEDQYKHAKFIKRELKHSSFKRSFKIGDSLDSNKIDATFEAGILTITIPKKEEAKPRTININIPFSGPKAAFNGSLKSNIISNKRGKRGSARNKSVSLMRMLSNLLKNPATTPTNVPKNNDKAIAVKPTAIEVCPPCIILAKVSLPS